jgi:hypothetical protein
MKKFIAHLKRPIMSNTHKKIGFRRELVKATEKNEAVVGTNE